MKMFQTKIVEKIGTYILLSVIFFSSKNRAICEIMWKNTVEPEWPQMTNSACLLQAG
jgi:hypothetical protein